MHKGREVIKLPLEHLGVRGPLTQAQSCCFRHLLASTFSPWSGRPPGAAHAGLRPGLLASGVAGLPYPFWGHW